MSIEHKISSPSTICRRPSKKRKSWGWLFLFFMGILSGPAFAEEQVSAVLHVHSSVSSGVRAIAEIAELARKYGVQVLFVTDLLNERYEYGVGPFHFLKQFYERNSIAKYGTRKFLDNIDEVNRKDPGILVIDGAIATPFYYWTGNPLFGQLTLNSRGKDLMLLGVSEEAKYARLPVIQNGNSPFSPYKGNQYAKPYQYLIDDQNAKDSVTVWSHPCAYEEMVMGPVILSSGRYLDEVKSTFRYTGIGLSLVEMTMLNDLDSEVLAAWDSVLKEYCAGKRKEPVWIFGELDYSGREGASHIGTYLNMIYVEERSRKAVLESMKKGLVYLVRQKADPMNRRRFDIETFEAADSASSLTARMGETLTAEGTPIIRLKLRFSDDSQDGVTLRLIKNGKWENDWELTAPFSWEFKDENAEPGKSFYRVMAWSNHGDNLATNPIFVERK